MSPVRCLVSTCLLLLATRGQAGEDLISQLPIGNGPVAIEIADDSRTAVIPLLFPEGETDPNLIVVDLIDNQIVEQFRVGRRMFDTAVIPATALGRKGPGFLTLSVFGDQDEVSLIDLQTGEVVRTYPVGSRPGGVSALIDPQGAGVLAVVANGSSGDVTVIDLVTGQTSTSPGLGLDPRNAAFHPGGRYVFVALGGSAEVAVFDRVGGNVVARVAVGNDPVDLNVSADGGTVVVTNVTNNTISIIDTGDPAAPVLRRTPGGATQLAVGVQPSRVALAPDGSQAYIANTGSAFVSVVDLNAVELAGVLPVQREGAAVATGISALNVSKDGRFLAITDRGNDAQLSLYDRVALNLQEAPPIEIPGEPAADILLTSDPEFACPGFYIASIALQNRAPGGFFATEILTTAGPRLLQGGLNLGAGFGADGTTPGFAAFNIANRSNEPQSVAITVDIEPLDPATGSVMAELDLIGAGGVMAAETVTGDTRLTLSATVDPGFYRVRVRSLAGSPAGLFSMAMTTRFVDRPGGGFQGGVNVGGLLARENDGSSTTGFASFCIAEGQIVRFRTVGQITAGPTGAGPMVLTVRDRARVIVRRIVNSIPPAPLVIAPPAPDLIDTEDAIYVEAGAPPGGTGSESRPLGSITDALGRVAEAGDTVIVLPGIYSPSTTGEVLPLGSPGAGLNRIPDGVTLLGSGADNTIIDAQEQTANGANVNAVVIGGNNVRMAGFTVRNATAAGVFVIDAQGVQIDHNLLTGNARFGLGSLNADGIMIHDNVAVANSESGIALSASTLLRASTARSVPAICPDQFGACVVRNIANDHRADGILATQGGHYHVAENQCYNNGVSGIEYNNGAPPDQPPFPPLTGSIVNNTTIGNGGVQFAFSGTGILVTEFSAVQVVAGNVVSNNRPGGIAIFEDASAQRISGNTIRNNAQNGMVAQKRATVLEITENIIDSNGLTGIFVDDESTVTQIRDNEVNANGSCLECNAARAGFAVLGGSEVEAFSSNNLVDNTVGFEVNNRSRVGLFDDSPVENSLQAGGLVRTESSIDLLQGGLMLGSGSIDPALRISDSSIKVMGYEIISNAGGGFSAASDSMAELINVTISRNGVDGVAARTGSMVTVDDSRVSANGGNGVLTTGEGTTVLIRNSVVTDNSLRGVNAAGASSISCENVDLTNNSEGATFGNVTGC